MTFKAQPDGSVKNTDTETSSKWRHQKHQLPFIEAGEELKEFLNTYHKNKTTTKEQLTNV